MTYSPSPPFGLYIHWPFCQSKCPYCDFNSHVSAQIDEGAWRCAYQKALHIQGREMGGRPVGSIYFGGGTPSLMDIETVAKILEVAADIFSFTSDIEITLEANPTSVELKKLNGFRAAGVNRLSLGIQALNDEDLRRLGRTHTAQESLHALELARDIFPRISFDLIYARQHQTLKAWERELNTALDLVGDHFSLYQLTIEPNTVFHTRHAKGKLGGLVGEELGADMYEMTLQNCAGRGLSAYEVSNFARTGHESRHNLVYWQAGDYLGVGPGAHGRFFRESTRFETRSHRAPALWLEAVLEGRDFLSEECLSDEAYLQEMFLMGLRLKRGILRTRLEGMHGFSQKQESIKELVQEGLLELDETHLRASARGRLLLDSLLQKLL